MLQRESIKRLDRLNMVVGKMKEVREQRQTLLSRLRDEMNREDKEAAAAGQEDADILGELRGSEIDATVVVKKKLDDRYGNLVRINKYYNIFINTSIISIKLYTTEYNIISVYSVCINRSVQFFREMTV